MVSGRLSSGMSAPAQPGEALPGAGGGPGRPSQGTSTRCIESESRQRRPRGLPARPAKTSPAFRPGGPRRVLGLPQKGWVSLCGSRMPSTLRDTGPGQRPQLPGLRWPRGTGPWWGCWAQLESPSSAQWSCSVRALSGGPLMFITKQPASWRPCGSQTAKRAGDDSEIPL